MSDSTNNDELKFTEDYIESEDGSFRMDRDKIQFLNESKPHLYADLAPPEEHDIKFMINGEEIMAVKQDGIHYRGRVLEMDKEVEEAFRDFLTKIAENKYI